MSILFAGGEMGAFVPATANVNEYTTIGGITAWDASFARCALKIGNDSDYAESADFGTGADLFCHFDMLAHLIGTGSNENHRFRWCDGSGTEVIRLVQIYSGQVLRLDYWNGAAWVSAGSITVSMTAARQTIDIHAVVNSASGSIKVYLSGTERIDSGTIDLSGITSLGKVRFYGGVNTYYSYVSQVIVADESTIGMRLFTVPVTGAGATSSWTGTYTEIDEIIYADADFINSASVNQVSTFATTVPSLTGYQTKAIAVTARAKCGASGPQNIEMALRSAGTNYFSSNFALDAGYRAFCNVWNTDPATAGAWAGAAVTAAQPGVKSIT